MPLVLRTVSVMAACYVVYKICDTIQHGHKLGYSHDIKTKWFDYSSRPTTPTQTPPRLT